ncbi:basic proline-rich protein-like [Falco cherrug]|uniref:basic proline-rich protein-like n=1 Tax=Falco cherrug TaxID=345164 RepID=UPI00247A2479|nr:basic proline-rich protein-like [Falco cherrug]
MRAPLADIKPVWPRPTEIGSVRVAEIAERRRARGGGRAGCPRVAALLAGEGAPGGGKAAAMAGGPPPRAPLSSSGPQHDCASHDPPPPPSPSPQLRCRFIQVIHHLLLPPLPRSRIFLPIPSFPPPGESGAASPGGRLPLCMYLRRLAPDPSPRRGSPRVAPLTPRNGRRPAPPRRSSPLSRPGGKAPGAVSPGGDGRPRVLPPRRGPPAGREVRARCGRALRRRDGAGEAGLWRGCGGRGTPPAPEGSDARRRPGQVKSFICIHRRRVRVCGCALCGCACEGVSDERSRGNALLQNRCRSQAFRSD